MVVFPAKVGSQYTLVARRFTPNSGWSGAVALDTEGYKGTTSVSGADIAVDRAGNALVIWTTRMTYVVSQSGNVTTYDTISEFRSQHFDVTGGWESTHETNDIDATGEQAVALDDSGNGFVVGITNGTARAARWLSGSGWRSSIVLGDAPAQGFGVAASPRVTIDRRGGAAALWRNGTTLMISRFGAGY
jgi:hypothetical protein